MLFNQSLNKFKESSKNYVFLWQTTAVFNTENKFFKGQFGELKKVIRKNYPLNDLLVQIMRSEHFDENSVSFLDSDDQIMLKI